MRGYTPNLNFTMQPICRQFLQFCLSGMIRGGNYWDWRWLSGRRISCLGWDHAWSAKKESDATDTCKALPFNWNLPNTICSEAQRIKSILELCAHMDQCIINTRAHFFGAWIARARDALIRPAPNGTATRKIRHEARPPGSELCVTTGQAQQKQRTSWTGSRTCK